MPGKPHYFLVTDYVPDGFTEAIESMGYHVDYLPVLDNIQLGAIIDRYQGMVISTHVTLDKLMLERAARLKYILRPGSGLDNVDLDFARLQGITVFNSPEANSVAVAEHAIGLLFGLVNNIPRAFEAVKQHKWLRQENTGTRILGKTIGIIGYGHTGSAFAVRIQSFGMRILVYDKYKSGFGNSIIEETTLQAILENAEIISLHIPLTPETHHFVNDKFIQKAGKPFFLLNTSRGKIVDTASLMDGIKSKKIRGAALDVLENEKLETYSTNEKAQLNELIATGHVIITPHIAGWTTESRKEIFFAVLENFRDFLKLG
ncbi:MAG: hypothetical protein M3Q97_05605 [Bacteroidota bacterium]|nr:hypothetical protein [Bacteroidota bacterium]